MQIELVKAPLDLAPFAADWEQLFRARPHEPSLSLEWTKALLVNHLNPADEPSLVVFRHNGSICALLPMVQDTSYLAGLPLSSLRALSECSNTHSDLLCRQLNEDFVTELLEVCGTRTAGWDVMRFTRIVEDSDLDRALSGALSVVKCRNHIRLEPPSFFLTLPESYDTYLNARSSKFRNYLRRMEKGLQPLGRVRFRRTDSPEELLSDYENLLSVERASWKHNHGTAISAVPHQEAFYGEMAKGALEAGRLHLTFLDLDNKPVAYNFGLVAHGRYYYLKTSFHEAFRRNGVATVSRAWLIRMLIEQGIREFDFPGEPYQWENQWTDELRWHRSITIFNDTGMGRIYHSLTRVRDRYFHRQATARTVTYHKAKYLQPNRGGSKWPKWKY